MFSIENYISALIPALQRAFDKRLLYVGLQGSYLRNEATENSDIDIMVILENFQSEDLDAYQSAIRSVGDFERSCGFICGREEMNHWNTLELCHLLHSTRDYYGRLADYIPEYTDEDVRVFAKLSLNNLFHEICHRRIHADRAKNIAALPRTYKSVFFILQNIHYLESGEFVPTKKGLLHRLNGSDKAVLEALLRLQSAQEYDFEEEFRLLFDWCRERIVNL